MGSIKPCGDHSSQVIGGPFAAKFRQALRRGTALDDPVFYVAWLKATLADGLGIQPSEVDDLTTEEAEGFLIYLHEKMKKEKDATRDIERKAKRRR